MDSLTLLIGCNVSPMTPAAQNNVPIIGVKDEIFGSPNIIQTKSVPLAVCILRREVVYRTQDTGLSVHN